MRLIKVYGPSLVLFLVLSAAALSSRGLIVRAYVHDMFFVADSIWRSYLGEVPHVDFQTPIGQAFYWPYVIVSQLSGGSIMDVLSANVFVASILLLLGLAVLPARFPPLLLFLGLATIVITALTGRSVDSGLFTYDYLAPYNRWGWSFSILAAFIIAVPPSTRARKHQAVIDGLCLGLAVATLYYMKLSYFAGIFGLAAGTAVIRVFPIRTLLLSLATFGLVVLLVENLFGNNLLYIQELIRTAEVNVTEGRGAFRVIRSAVFTAVGAVFGGAAILIILAYAPLSGPREWLRIWWRPLAAVALVIAAGTLIRVQNHSRWEMGMLGAALLIAAEYGRRSHLRGHAGAQREGTSSRPAGRPVLARAILIVGVAALPALDAASILAHSIESRRAAACTAPALRGTPMERLLFPRPHLLQAGGGQSLDPCWDILSKPPGPGYVLYSNEADYRRLLRTVPLLRKHGQPSQEAILSLDFANPYPFVFRAPPVRGALIWLDLGRSYSSKIHPDAAALLDGTDVVVQADFPYAPYEPSAGGGLLTRLRESLRSAADNGMSPAQHAWSVYGPAVRRRFTSVARDGEITLWRKEQSPPPQRD